MTFSLSLNGGEVEWGSRGELRGLFAQPGNALRPRFLAASPVTPGPRHFDFF